MVENPKISGIEIFGQSGTQSPTADAGPDQVLTLPTNSTVLNGTGIDPDGGSIVSYSWIQLSGPAATLSGANTADLSVSDMTAGVHQFQLTVTDDEGEMGTATATVTVNNAATQIPTADAGPDQVLTLPTNSTVLNGTGIDPDGGSIVSYSWIQLSGPAATLSGANTADLSVSDMTAGVHHFQLTVTDDEGEMGTATATVTVNNAATQIPTADAGPDQVLTLPTNSTVLNGTGIDPDGGSIVSYSWIQLSGPAATLSGANTADLSVSDMTAGVHQFQLTVTDDEGEMGTATATVTVNNAATQIPTADAGPDQVLTLPTNSTVLNGTGIDPDGGSIVSYSWIQLSGPAATLSGANTADLSVSDMTAGVHQFQLTVTDDEGEMGTATATVTVNNAATQIPTADAGPDQVLTLPTNSTVLNGTGIDPDGGSIVSYSWIQLSGPATTLSGANTADLSVSDMTAGVHQFQLTVTDDEGEMGTATVTVTVNGGASATVMRINSGGGALTLNGDDWSADQYHNSTNSYTKNVAIANTTIDQLYQTERFINTGAPLIYDIPVTGSGPFDVNCHFAEIYFGLPGSGSSGGVGSRIFNIDIEGQQQLNNYDIVAQAGGSATAVVESFTGITVSDGNLTITLTSVVENPKISGIEIFGQSGTQSPTADAGPDQVLTLPTNSTVLNGTGIDPDGGSIVSYSWIQLSGPAATLSGANTADLSVSDMTVGVHQFQLTVTDDEGEMGTATATVTVNNAATQIPTADAGPDQVLTLPTNSTVLNGTGIDPDGGSIVSYSWIQLSGPAATLSGANTADLSVSDMTAGVHQFQLTVTDDEGEMGTATATVTVNNAATQSPVVDAGPDQVLTLPTNSTALNGTATDPDGGSIVSYSWIKLSGPAVTFAGENTADLSLYDMVAGVYQFELTATDDEGETGTATVTVTVNSATVTAMRINSGGGALTLNGDDWSADQYHNSTASYTKNVAIANTTIDQLYQTERFIRTGTLIYDIPVSGSGPFDVYLHFAEIYFGLPGSGSSGGVGSRIFNVDIEGQEQLTNYDIVAQAGGSATAIVEGFTGISVSDGNLTITLTSVVENPKISGIEILDGTIPTENEDDLEVTDLLTGDDPMESESSLRIYPNPAINTFTVEMSYLEAEHTRFDLIDPVGRIINLEDDILVERGKTTLQFDVQSLDLSSGLYYLRVHSDQLRKTNYKLLIAP